MVRLGTAEREAVKSGTRSVEQGHHAVMQADEEFTERVGEPEPCDWCGRAGTVRQHEFYREDVLVCRNPSLCDACFVFFDVDGDVIDIFYEKGVDFDALVETPMEEAFVAAWRVKVAAGQRLPT